MARKRPNAYSQLIQEGSRKEPDTGENSETPQNSEEPQSGNTVKRQDTVKPQNRKKVKITFYPEEEQEEKIYDLMELYRKRTGVKINQQDLFRRLLEVATIDILLP
jgi:hypothetical protein